MFHALNLGIGSIGGSIPSEGRLPHARVTPEADVLVAAHGSHWWGCWWLNRPHFEQTPRFIMVFETALTAGDSEGSADGADEVASLIDEDVATDGAEHVPTSSICWRHSAYPAMSTRVSR